MHLRRQSRVKNLQAQLSEYERRYGVPSERLADAFRDVFPEGWRGTRDRRLPRLVGSVRGVPSFGKQAAQQAAQTAPDAVRPARPRWAMTSGRHLQDRPSLPIHSLWRSCAFCGPISVFAPYRAARVSPDRGRPWHAATLAGSALLHRDRDGQGARVQLCRPAAGVTSGARVPGRDRGHGHGLRPRPRLRGVRGPGLPPGHPLRETPAVKAGKHRPPTCEHGEWTFAGSDAKRRAAKWRCPTGECSPASTWVGASRLHTLIPRGTARWQKLYRLRGAVERENGRLKNEWALLPLRVRRIERVALHADLTILARLATALAKART